MRAGTWRRAMPVWTTLRWAIAFAKRIFGCLVVFAAGNDGTDNEIYPLYPANFSNDPLLAGKVMTVLATDRYDAKAFFSNYGKNTVPIGGARHAHPDDGTLSREPAALCRIQRHLGRGGLRLGGRGAGLRPQSGLAGPAT